MCMHLGTQAAGVHAWQQHGIAQHSMAQHGILCSTWCASACRKQCILLSRHSAEKLLTQVGHVQSFRLYSSLSQRSHSWSVQGHKRSRQFYQLHSNVAATGKHATRARPSPSYF